MRNRTDRKVIFEDLRQMIIDNYADYGFRTEKITEESILSNEGLGLDSVDVLRLFSIIENEYGVHIPEGEIEYIKTINDIILKLSEGGHDESR